jgi:X-X-X-Leu-X-X-Gly heptad repeat protein
LVGQPDLLDGLAGLWFTLPASMALPCIVVVPAAAPIRTQGVKWYERIRTWPEKVRNSEFAKGLGELGEGIGELADGVFNLVAGVVGCIASGLFGLLLLVLGIWLIKSIWYAV